MKKFTTLIFGGLSGIGSSITQEFEKRGDTVFTVSRRETRSPNHISYDFLSKARFPFTSSIDHVVFSQRYRGDNPVDETTVMLHQPCAIIKSLAHQFEAQGSVTFLGSTAGSLTALEQPLHYHQIRAGIEAMTRFFAVELGKSDIRCNCVIPTTIIKPQNKEFYTLDNEARIKIEKITPLGRMGTALDIASVVEFLASPRASFVNGQCITVDGGTSALGHEAIAKMIER
jgi:NAD(P)-dependent dehydrogenase (short-subunit alcohol dehydrogenase family)